MGIDSKIRELRKTLGKIDDTAPTAEELTALNIFCGDMDGVLEQAQATFAALAARLSRWVDFENSSNHGFLDVPRAIAALGMARGELKQALEDALRARGVLQ